MYFLFSFKLDFGLTRLEFKIITNYNFLVFSLARTLYFTSTTGGGLLRKAVESPLNGVAEIA